MNCLIDLSYIYEKKVTLKIYSFYYQAKSFVSINENYSRVWAGKNNQHDVNGFIGDDTGDNISDKNKYYSELTGLYWVWKNTKSDIVGSCHYRRYFTNYKEPFLYRLKRILYYPAGVQKKRFGLIYTKNISFWKSKILSENEIVEILESYDAIMPKRRKLRQSIKNHYEKYHNPTDHILLNNILSDFYPEYLLSYKLMLNEKRLLANNMFVMRWEKFDEMMNWLFSILFEFEKRTVLDNYKGYQERIFGFLSERLITLWVIHNKLYYKELPLIYFKKLKNKSDA